MIEWIFNSNSIYVAMLAMLHAYVCVPIVIFFPTSYCGVEQHLNYYCYNRRHLSMIGLVLLAKYLKYTCCF